MSPSGDRGGLPGNERLALEPLRRPLSTGFTGISAARGERGEWREAAGRGLGALGPAAKAPRGVPPAFWVCFRSEDTGCGKARQALPALLVVSVSSAKAVAPRPGFFSWQPQGPADGQALGFPPATRPPQPHHPPWVYGPQVYYHRTCQEGCVTSFPQPTPDPPVPGGRPAGAPCERIQDTVYGSPRGAGISLFGGCHMRYGRGRFRF